VIFVRFIFRTLDLTEDLSWREEYENKGIQYMTTNKNESLKTFAKYLQNSDPTVNAYLYDDITSRIEKDLRPTREAIQYMLDLIVLDLPQAQRVSDKDFWDLSLLDEIQKSGFIDQLQKN